MPLMECRLCGKIFTEGGRKNVCPECLIRLGDLYSKVHKYMRDHDDEEFDIERLSDEMDANLMDIQALVDLGYIERDISLYGTRETDWGRLAQELSDELGKMNKKVTTYGGDIYSRGNKDGVRTVRRR